MTTELTPEQTADILDGHREHYDMDATLYRACEMGAAALRAQRQRDDAFAYKEDDGDYALDLGVNEFTLSVDDLGAITWASATHGHSYIAPTPFGLALRAVLESITPVETKA